MKIFNIIISSKFESLFHYLNTFSKSVEVFNKNLITVNKDNKIISFKYLTKQKEEITVEVKDNFLDFKMSFNVNGNQTNDSVTFGDIIKDNQEIDFPFLDENFIAFLELLTIKIEQDL